MLCLFKRDVSGFFRGGIYDLPVHVMDNLIGALKLKNGEDFEDLVISERGKPALKHYQEEVDIIEIPVLREKRQTIPARRA